MSRARSGARAHLRGLFGGPGGLFGALGVAFGVLAGALAARGVVFAVVGAALAVYGAALAVFGVALAVFGVALAVFGAALAAPPSKATPPQGRTVLVLLFDGFAPAFVEAFPTPWLDRLRSEGSFTHHLEPAFPTMSSVNQVTLSTGCWPERHGIAANKFLDPERGLYDESADADWLLDCEHLHQVAERQGVRTAALGWVGRRSASRGALASEVSPETHFEELPDDTARAREVAALLRRPIAERPRLVLAYFRGPDDVAHFTGMDSAETRDAVARSDAAIGTVVAAIDALPERDRITLVVTTDHGMLPVSRIVNVTRILRNRGITARAVSTGTTAFLYLDEPETAGSALEALGRYAEFEVWARGCTPETWHLGTGPRIGDLVLSAHPPYFIEDVALWPAWLRWLGRWGPEFIWARFSMKASHGYPPGTPGIEGILYAWGSGVARGHEIERVRAIDLHPTVAFWLGVHPGVPMDGRLEPRLLAADARGGLAGAARGDGRAESGPP